MPHSPADIFPDDSPFVMYRRAAENADASAHKGDFKTSRELYHGITSRIQNDDIQSKVQDDLDYMDNYEQIITKHKKERKQTEEKARNNEIRVSLAGPVGLTDRIQIGITPPTTDPPFNVDKIADEITERLVTGDMMRQYRQQFDSLKQELSRITEETVRPQSPAPAVSEPASFSNTAPPEISSAALEQISRLKEDVARLSHEMALRDSMDNANRHRTGVEQPEPAGSSPVPSEQYNHEPAGAGRDASDTTSNQSEVEHLRKEIDNLKNNMLSMYAGMQNSGLQIPEAHIAEARIADVHVPEARPTMIEARYTEPVEIKLADNIIDILKNIPRDSGTAMPVPPGGTGYSAPQEENNAAPILPPAEAEKAEEEQALAAAEKFLTEPPKPPAQPAPPVQTAAVPPAKNEPKDDGMDEFDLLKDIEQGEQFDEPSEEDIYERLLKSGTRDKNENNESFEIQGDKKQAAGFKSMTTQEEKFYEKFFDNGRSKKRELPILHVSYNFSRLPDEFSLSRDKNVLEHTFYKYKPMLETANEFIKKRRVKDALNYYKVIMDQNVPAELKVMLRQNIRDLNEYLEKYLTAD